MTNPKVPEVNAPQLDVPLSPAMTTALVIVEELIRSGIREAVVCPGSRSAPLAIAIAEADRVGRLRMHVRTDERTAAFLALGLAKYSRRAVPVVMTSGTAVANCLPAMVEATLTHVPLMVLSANRPLKMVGTGANQTIDQVGIFGSHSVCTRTLDQIGETCAQRGITEGLPADQVDFLRNTVGEVIAAAMHPTEGGGVQLDVPLREPLVPEDSAVVGLGASEIQESLSQGQHQATNQEQPAGPAGTQEKLGRPGGSEVDMPTVRKTDTDAVAIDLGKRTLAIVGEVTDRAWGRRIMEQLSGVPTMAEPVAPDAPEIPVHSAAAAMFTADTVAHGEYSAVTRPEQIVVVGRPTLHRPVARLLADPEIRVVVVTDTNTVTDVSGTAAAVTRAITLTGEVDQQWLSVCRAISDMGAEAVRRTLEESDEFTAIHAVAAVADSLRDGDAVVLGASTTVRDASRAGLPFSGVAAYASRGAAGIDGTVSTAAGVAFAHASSEPHAMRAPRTIAVMGDLTFLHDIGGLNIGPLEPHPDNLLIIVTNDNGGGIFETLEPGREQLRRFPDGSEMFERIFGTPLRANLGELCAGFGVPHRLVTTPTELALAIEEHAELGYLSADDDAIGSGIAVIEAQVSRAGRRNVEKAIREAVTPR
ncbi:2-succinyl-5-enolpyruvyl-6-hydroxy-3-cyclohexene-1-carboxylic-acid synthase [Corynebacterium auriscanis]|uniref:2-succinyl-5-enolpyruvyl-6-hydroxy-3-cyclohexene-1-carboxylate synthase n=1 Tax=Corynebacterium auriscanis TaxID=99807 RepID=A0A0A2DLQ5_9CORY|nr:2-succinyl-5-enolpyruvyl-6-hydroxy-3-cyclohexene-1-carboxylic-acid synthase [Corynebacterium auriscanis]KGM18839.1 2-succinyl-5-enolpyruvyl-6-hydroxy-3-cyclohexene-1-carboxylate synthase [Corynebacterium auriscanis]